MTLENIVSVVTLLGLGGAVGTYLRILWGRQKEAELHKQEFKEIRYECVVLLMYAALDFERHAPLLREHGRNFGSLTDLMDELATEWHNMILFASEEVLVAVHEFIRSPLVETFRKSAIAMRADLWGGRVSDKVLSLKFGDVKAN